MTGVQCVVLCCAVSPLYRPPPSSPPSRHHQHSVSRETGDVRTHITLTPLWSTKHQSHISGLIFSATEYRSDNIQTCWARGQPSHLTSPSLHIKIRKLSLYFPVCWSSLSVIRISHIRSSKMMKTDFQISQAEKYPVTT